MPADLRFAAFQSFELLPGREELVVPSLIGDEPGPIVEGLAS